MNADRLFVNLERNEPTPGQLLVAAPGNDDHPRAAFLIIEHDTKATYGVDLTTRSEAAVFNLLPEWLELVSKPQAFYIGGLTDPQNVLGIGMSAPGVKVEEQPELKKLAPRLVYVNMQNDPEKLKPLLSGLRLFAGFTAWTNQQLEAEIADGDWYVAPALAQDVIAPGGADLWGDIMKRQPMPLPLYATYPKSPEEN